MSTHLVLPEHARIEHLAIILLKQVIQELH